MSPLLVVTLVPTARRLLASLMVKLSPKPVMLATSVETLELSAEEFSAVTVSRLPETWLVDWLRVTLPLAAFSVTLPVPAMMLPEPFKLLMVAVESVIERSPLARTTFAGPMARFAPVKRVGSYSFVTVRFAPLPIMAVSALIDVLTDDVPKA